MKLQNKGVVVYTAGFKVHPERKDAVQVQAELQAAFDRHTPHLLAFGSCCQGDRVHCYQGGCGSEGVLLLLFALGCREHFVSGCWHSSERDCGRHPRECWLSTLGVLHPGVAVMWYGHIRDLFPTAEGCKGSRLPNVTMLHWAYVSTGVRQ